MHALTPRPLPATPFRHGMLQAGFPMELQFRVPPDDQMDHIAAWMAQALETDPDSAPLRLACATSGFESATRFLTLWLLIARTLMQDVKLPVFERPALEAIGTQGIEVQARVWMPLPEGHGAQCVHEWVRLALQAIQDMAQARASEDDREAAYQAFHRSHILPWRERVPGGKSIVSLLQSAFDQGVPAAHVGEGRYLLGWGARAELLHNSASSGDSALGQHLANHKAFAVNWMHLAGIPTPRGVWMSADDFAIDPIDRLASPRVIKPVDRDRGEGVSLDLTEPAATRRAFDQAARLSKEVLAEEQIPGICHRILVVDDQVLYVVRRNPKSITGDGIQTVAQCVAQHNTRLKRLIPIKRLPLYVLDDAAQAQLARQGLEAHSVPSAGQVVALRSVQSTAWGGEPEEVTDQLHPDNAALALRVARHFRLRCAGIDFITQDIAVPWHVNGAVINEVNYSPVIGRTHAYQRRASAAYIRALMPDQGRIPVEVWVGADLQARVDERMAHTQACALRVVSDAQGPGPLMQALTQSRYDPDLQGLLIHIGHAETLKASRWPLPWVDQLTVSPGWAERLQASNLGLVLSQALSAGPVAIAGG